jgi:hypothetical protein
MLNLARLDHVIQVHLQRSRNDRKGIIFYFGVDHCLFHLEERAFSADGAHIHWRMQISNQGEKIICELHLDITETKVYPSFSLNVAGI